ncbi:MAG TPA: protein-disulfide reductase DsbD domain-containing protein [Terriglobales bacterium]|nr:protein-disulfide reductase DsbD domain-containing protein [Terriglobales bacterium]
MCLASLQVRLLVLLLFAAASAWASDALTSPVELNLVSENQAISPGQPFWIGLHFDIARNWHIYWINAGDSGEPPKVQWDLPPGFTAGEIQWPTPERFQMDTIVDYGYHDQAVLLVPITAPPTAKPGTRVNLAANVKWLMCRNVCMPGKARVTLAVPVAQTSAPDTAVKEFFDKSRMKLPKPLPKTWKASVSSRPQEFVLNIKAGKSVSDARFFPLEPEQIDNAAEQKLTPGPRGWELHLKKSDQLLKSISNLKGVLVVTANEGYFIDAPVADAASKKSVR